MASTLAVLEEPFSLPLRCGAPLWGWPRPELDPSACGELRRERRRRKLGLSVVLQGCGFQKGMGSAGPTLGQEIETILANTVKPRLY